MRKFVLMLFIAAVSNNAIAGWDETFSDDEVTVYADTDTVIKKGARVKMWGLHDYSTEQTTDGISYLSVKKIKQDNSILLGSLKIWAQAMLFILTMIHKSGRLLLQVVQKNRYSSFPVVTILNRYIF